MFFLIQVFRLPLNSYGIRWILSESLSTPWEPFELLEIHWVRWKSWEFYGSPLTTWGPCDILWNHLDFFGIMIVMVVLNSFWNPWESCEFCGIPWISWEPFEFIENPLNSEKNHRFFGSVARIASFWSKLHVAKVDLKIRSKFFLLEICSCLSLNFAAPG